MRGKLYTRPRVAGLRSIGLRIGVLFIIIFSAVLLVYFEGGLIDNKTGTAPGLIDSLYFAMVTITTVGYGDIVPYSTFARMTDTFVLAPMRFIILILFVGIAYDLAIQRFQEDYRMQRAVRKLDGHIVICGYGETGRAALCELVLGELDRDQVVVLDTRTEALEDASALEVVAVQGDATHEDILKSVAIERARHVLICPGRDDTAVLISLTVRDLNPDAQLVVMCHEQENVRLIERTGANTIISPSFAGGNLLAAATRKPHIVDTMKNLLSVGGTMRMDERAVRPDEVGKWPGELAGIAVVRVYRHGAYFDVAHFPQLQSGDILIYISGGQTDKPDNSPETAAPRAQSNQPGV